MLLSGHFGLLCCSDGNLNYVVMAARHNFRFNRTENTLINVRFPCQCWPNPAGGSNPLSKSPFHGTKILWKNTHWEIERIDKVELTIWVANPTDQGPCRSSPFVDMHQLNRFWDSSISDTCQNRILHKHAINTVIDHLRLHKLKPKSSLITLRQCCLGRTTFLSEKWQQHRHKDTAHMNTLTSPPPLIHHMRRFWIRCNTHLGHVYTPDTSNP